MTRTSYFIRWFSLAFVSTALFVGAWDLFDWVQRNGWAYNGESVNHFGEPFSTTIVQACGRSFFSPFAWFAIFIIFCVASAFSKSILDAFDKPRAAATEG